MGQSPGLNYEAGCEDSADEPGHAQFAVAHRAWKCDEHERQRRNQIDLPEIIKFEPGAPDKSAQSLVLLCFLPLSLVVRHHPWVIVSLLRPRPLPEKITPHAVGFAVDVRRHAERVSGNAVVVIAGPCFERSECQHEWQNNSRY